MACKYSLYESSDAHEHAPVPIPFDIQWRPGVSCRRGVLWPYDNDIPVHRISRRHYSSTTETIRDYFDHLVTEIFSEFQPSDSRNNLCYIIIITMPTYLNTPIAARFCRSEATSPNLCAAAHPELGGKLPLSDRDLAALRAELFPENATPIDAAELAFAEPCTPGARRPTPPEPEANPTTSPLRTLPKTWPRKSPRRETSCPRKPRRRRRHRPRCAPNRGLRLPCPV